jgi:hypothetical protein
MKAPRLVGKQKHDVTGFGLLPQKLQAQAGAVGASQTPFFLSRMLSRDCEMAGPPRRSISARSRGIVQFGRSRPPLTGSRWQ